MPAYNVLSLNDIMADCPEKLLAHYPRMLREMEARKKARIRNCPPEEMPPLPILCIKGWRLSGKSQFAIRGGIGAILDGWAQSMMLATITEKGAIDTMNLIDAVLEEAEEQVIFSRDSDHPIRTLSQGENIYIDFLNKQDSKARQSKADILIIEELEHWNERKGNASLITMVRHFDLMIVLSNEFPRWAKNLFASFNATFEEITYHDNKKLEKSVKDAMERRRIEDPDGWARDVAYLPTAGGGRVFSERAIGNAFLPHNPKFQRKICILSIDSGAGGADPTVIMRLDFDGYAIESEILTDECIATDIIVNRVGTYRSSQRAEEEIWDAQGVGLATMQFRAPRDDWARAGIVPFSGAAVNKADYFNARAEAIMLTAAGLDRGNIKLIGLTETQKAQFEAECRAHTIYEGERNARTNSQAIQLDKKEKVKERLGGVSPNILDALSMGVWRLLTYTIHNDSILPSGQGSFNPTDSGAPSL